MSARSLMNHVSVRSMLPREVSEYSHPYGGIAKDAWLTRDQFARFMNIPVEYVDQMPRNMKVIDHFFDRAEVCGYIYELHGVTYYRVTIVDFKRQINLVNRSH